MPIVPTCCSVLRPLRDCASEKSANKFATSIHLPKTSVSSLSSISISDSISRIIASDLRSDAIWDSKNLIMANLDISTSATAPWILEERTESISAFVILAASSLFEKTAYPSCTDAHVVSSIFAAPSTGSVIPRLLKKSSGDAATGIITTKASDSSVKNPSPYKSSSADISEMGGNFSVV